jgi:Tfp pilus assembly protein PilX
MHKQSGAVLIVALIFLLLITAIAASLMTSGSFETVMVDNKQQREAVFHLSESAVEQITKNQAAFNSALNANGTPYTASAALKPLGSSTKSYSVQVEYLKGPGTKRLPINNSFGLVTNQTFEIRADAGTVDGKVVTELVQGVTRMMPNPIAE